MIEVWLLVAILSTVSAAVSRDKRQSDRGPLYDYVYRQDPAYSYTLLDTVPQDGFTTYFFNLTSQQWYDETFTNHPVWWHYLVIQVPDTILYPDSGFLFISGGGINDGIPYTNGHVTRMGEYASSTGIVAGVIRMIPNQPIFFENYRLERSEDNLIAWTWRRFYNESHEGIDNPEVLARMPMTKASVRALDTIQHFVLGETGNAIEKFMVAGESKRGWTTWLVGGIDDRVVALAPVVLSCLNMNENFHHYYRSMGAWPWALTEYWLQGLMGLIDEPETQLMADIIDPISYRTWLTMPKLMISGASDEFFMPDDYDYFFKDLLGPSYMWLIENAGHSVGSSPSGEDYWRMLQTFYLAVLTNYQFPTLDWAKNATATGGQILFLSSETPLSISAFSAPSVAPNRRDWRTTVLDLGGGNGGLLETNIVWTESLVQNLGNNYYLAEFDNPSEGYLAFFIKASFSGPGDRVFYFTSQANVIPDTWPYEDCEGSGCFSFLV